MESGLEKSFYEKEMEEAKQKKKWVWHETKGKAGGLDRQQLAQRNEKNSRLCE